MPKNKDFKRLVRERQARTHESYSTARAQLIARRTAPSSPSSPSSSTRPLVCAVTGATGRVAYNLVFRLASGEVFGPDQPVAIRLVDVDDAIESVAGTAMELEDCTFPLLAQVDATSDLSAGFDGASWVLLLGAPRRTAGMERRDLLARTASTFRAQGEAIGSTASSDVRVVVVGNPANTNCLVARRAAPDVPDDRWTAMLRLDHNRARSRLADHLGVPLASVGRVSVWGNHSPTMVPDAWHATVDGEPVVGGGGGGGGGRVDDEWLETEFVPAVQHRGADLIEVSGASSAASAASALTDHVHDLVRGTTDWTSLGAVSRGEYGVPPGLVCGFPTVVRNGVASVVEGLDLGDVQRRLLDRSVDELRQEAHVAAASG